MARQKKENQQVLIQVRVDNELKEQASKVFDEIGIDIPTAIRVFFKAVVRDQALPFDLSVQKKTDMQIPERMYEYIRKTMMYNEPEGGNENTVVMLPLENGDIPVSMFVQLLERVPAGKIATEGSIFTFLSKLYGREVDSFPRAVFPRSDSEDNLVPYWRLVTDKGILIESFFCSRDMQKEYLTKEGIPVVQRGHMEGSYKVDNFKEYLFNFDTLKVVKE